MKEVLLAVQFLTTIPVKIKQVSARELADSASFFPVAGLLLGAAAAAACWYLDRTGLGAIASSAITVTLLIFLTGGMHLDGLADASDALFSGKTKEEMLVIMRDSRIGTMGVLGIIMAILLKIVLLGSIAPAARPAALIAMCVMGRWAMVFSMKLAPYARIDGKAKPFIEGFNTKIFYTATAIALISVIALVRIDGAIVFGAVTACAYAATRFIKRRIGGITGDTLGATEELCEIAALLCLCAIGRMGA